MPEMKRNVKDSVFTYLFSDPTYARELYLHLHPEDTGVTEEDCKLVTIQNILSYGQYNDLGLLIRDTLIILAEAQSTRRDHRAGIYKNRRKKHKGSRKHEGIGRYSFPNAKGKPGKKIRKYKGSRHLGCKRSMGHAGNH